MPERRPRCLLAGQATLLLEGLRSLLEIDFEVRLSSAEGHAAVVAATAFDPKVAIIDIASGDADVNAARLLRQALPDLPVVCLSGGNIEPVPGLHWINTAGCTRAKFLDAVHAACAPISRFSNRLSEKSWTPPSPAVDFTQRQEQVVSLLVRGLSMKEVGRVLHITPRTVAFHKYRFMQQNELRTNADLLAFCEKHGIGRR